MNTLSKALTTITLSLSALGMANASSLSASDNSISTELCMKAASGSRVALHQAIQNSGLSKEFVVYNVKCNDSNITDFVMQYGKNPEKITAVLNHGRTKGKVSINDVASL